VAKKPFGDYEIETVTPNRSNRDALVPVFPFGGGLEAPCQRSPKTIRNLISRHQLPRKILWKVRRRKRLRVMFLSPQTVRTLQELTLEAPLVKK
jgi:hypothetical protein